MNYSEHTVYVAGMGTSLLGALSSSNVLLNILHIVNLTQQFEDALICLFPSTNGILSRGVLLCLAVLKVIRVLQNHKFGNSDMSRSSSARS